MTRAALLALLVVTVAPTGAAAPTLTSRDARMGYSLSALVEVGQLLKREPGPGNVDTDPALEVCLLKLMKVEEVSFRGVISLSTSVNVAAQMRTAEDENAAVEGTTIEARWLRSNLADAKADVEMTVSRCQQFPRVVSIGKNLISALNDSINATEIIVQKTQNVRIDTGGHIE
jgi:hypothetical protein